MISYLGSAGFWTFVVISSIIFLPIAILLKLTTFAFDRRLIILHRFTSYWASLYTWLNPVWRVTIAGRDKIKNNVAYVMVCNHQSLVDILVLFRLFAHFKWVSKAENFKVPIVGWNMKMNRYIKLARGSLRSNIRMIKDAIATLNEGSSNIIFPEGTRSDSDQLRRFKPGAFELALKAKCPILPIVLNGSSDALPKAGIRLRGSHSIKVQVLDEIAYEMFSNLTAKELMEQVHKLIDVELKSLQTKGRIQVDP